MFADSKRERAPNFTSSEADLLVDLVVKYKNVIESRRTDVATNEEKRKTWERISQEFNLRSSGRDHRKPKILRTKYELVKRMLRKAIGEQKRLSHTEAKLLRALGPLIATRNSQSDLVTGDVDVAYSDDDSAMHTICEVTENKPDLDDNDLGDLSPVTIKIEDIDAEHKPEDVSSFVPSIEENSVPSTSSSSSRPARRLRLHGFRTSKRFKSFPVLARRGVDFSQLVAENLKLLEAERTHIENEERRKVLIYEEQMRVFKAQELRQMKEHDLRMKKLKLEIEALENRKLKINRPG